MTTKNRRCKPNSVKAIKYRGALDAERAAAGINAAIRNSRRLLADAKLLFVAGSYPTAAAIAALAIEECGKRGIVERILLAKSERQLKQSWREYTTHEAKNAGWPIPRLVENGASRLDDLRPVYSDDATHPYQLEDLKQWGLYTECRNRNYWSEPRHDIPRETAEEILHIADMWIRNAREVSVQQMELLVECLAPAWSEDNSTANPSAVRAAMKKYVAECQKRGLIPTLGINIDEFIGDAPRV